MSRRFAILALTLVALAAPSPAAASEGSAQLPGGRLLSHLEDNVPPSKTFRSGLRLEADGGYDVEVMTTGGGVFLIVDKGKFGKRYVGTAYLARGVATPERLQATFGKLGEVSMRFRESRNRTWVGKRRSCRGAQRFVKRRGVFVGKLRFKGEGGYISLNTHRAKGSVVTVAQKCLRQRRPGPPLAQQSSHQPAFLATARSGVEFTGFLALGGRKTTFLAAHEETRGKLAIMRVAVLRNKSEPLRANETLTRASISPPAPFHGTGRYRAAPDGTATWSGSLSVNFPGTPRFPLTGPDFEPLIEVPLFQE
ncbi:MAG TPA: hypothetical protein VLI94_11635 [Solirubrobacterales bacterium]|nr:hypothetical protein [Solirubrobacterales bacterium]